MQYASGLKTLAGLALAITCSINPPKIEAPYTPGMTINFAGSVSQPKRLLSSEWNILVVQNMTVSLMSGGNLLVLHPDRPGRYWVAYIAKIKGDAPCIAIASVELK